MVAVMGKRFDPAEHLTKQGWKGKGTALKSGHLTRPLAVIQKKTLSGVGKDRDEAVPFWDQIFAATAASLSLPSTPLSPSPAPTPPPNSSSSTPIPRLADPRGNKAGSWQTSGSSGSANHQPLGQAGLSIGVRIARDNARRGLYSRFFRGEDVVEPELEESGAEVMVDGGVAEAGPSRLGAAAGSPAPTAVEDGDVVEKEVAEEVGVNETKEERRARRALKAKRKEEKAEKKALRSAKKQEDTRESAEEETPSVSMAEIEQGGAADEAKERKKRKRRTEETVGKVELPVDPGSGDGIGEKKKKKKRRKDERLPSS